MNLKYITHNQNKYIVQSYAKDDIAHIVNPNSGNGFQLCLEQCKVTGTYGVYDEKWYAEKSTINVEAVKISLEKLFNQNNK